MKKIFITLIFSLISTTILVADLTRLEIGLGTWMSSPKGSLSYTANGVTANDISIKNDTSNPYIWVYFKHPVPIVPNIRLEYTSVNSEGLASGSFKNFIALNAKTDLDMTQYDIIPYYNILDNTPWVTLDLGLDIKLLDIDYKAHGVTVAGNINQEYSKSEMLALPLIYTRLRVEIPATDIGLEADAKFIKYSSSTVYDARVKLDYTLSIFPVLEPAIEVGYRIQKYDIDEAELDGKANIDFSGVYVGAMIRF